MRPRGAKASDDEVLTQLRRLWRDFGGRRGPMLRELRGPLNLACEQSRFKRLANLMEAQLDAEKE
jgi:hypothetical protein